MANPNPVMSESFLKKRFPTKYPEDPLSPKAIAIRFRTSVDKKLRAIPEYSGLVRTAVDQYFERIESVPLPEPKAIALPPIKDDGRPMPKVSARVPAVVCDAISTVPNSTAWLRRVITEAAQRELMKDGEV